MLGVQLSLEYDESLTSEILLSKVHKSILQWILKKLTLLQRVTAAKSYIASKTWYAFPSIPPQARVLARLSAILWSFVQNNKSF